MTNHGRRQTPSKVRPRTIFLILILLFLIPMLIALLMFKGHYIFGRLMNHGQLIKPPFSVALLEFRNDRGELLNNPAAQTKKNKAAQLNTNGKWLLVYFNPGLCEKDCQKGLNNLQQIRIATGKNRNRIARALLTYPSSPANDVAINLIISERYPGTQYFTTPKKSFATVIRQHINNDYALKSGTIYLIDPRGNVIMTYQPNAKPNGIFKDLERLLRASQIG